MKNLILTLTIILGISVTANAQLTLEGTLKTKKETFLVTTDLTFSPTASSIRSSTDTTRPVDEGDSHWNCDTTFEFDMADIETNIKDLSEQSTLSATARNLLAIRTVTEETLNPDDCKPAPMPGNGWVPFAVKQPRVASSSILLERTPSPGFDKLVLNFFDMPITVWALVENGNVTQVDVSPLTSGFFMTFQVVEQGNGSVSTLEQDRFFLNYRP